MQRLNALGATLALMILSLLAACGPAPSVRPDSGPTASIARAERLARSGDHAGSARTYETVALAIADDGRSSALIAAAREWLRVPSIDDARRVAATLDSEAGGDPRTAAARTLLVAEVAIAAGQPERALAKLRTLGDPPPTLAAEVWLQQARAQGAAGRALDSLHSFEARERALPPAALEDNQRRLWDTLRAAAARGANLAVPPGTDAASAGWLELARVATQGRRNPYAQRAQLADWRSRYPLHPANGPIVEALMDDANTQLPLPAQVALLLPLTGRIGDAGEAVRDGFLTAYYQQPEPTRPRLRIYDAAGDAGLAYNQAVDDGATFVVGPLGKENVQAVVHAAAGRVPTLALNLLPDGEPAPPHFFQFALAPEDEAQQAASRLLAAGKRTGVAMVPAGEWGTRVLAAFQTTYAAGGGTLVASGSYPPTNTDFKEQLFSVLGFEDSQKRQRALAAVLGLPLAFTPRRRDDLDCVFIAGLPQKGRLLRAQLRFLNAGDLPVYATSDIYEPNPIDNQDLEGVSFPDIPWMIAEDAAVSDLRVKVAQLWPQNARRRTRLFAMGFDAWRLIAELKDASGPVIEPLAGMTGRLTIDETGRVRRGLDFAVIGADGRPRPLPPVEPALP